MTDAPGATAEATETDDIQYDVKIEDSGPAAKKLTITIPADAVDEKIDDSFATLATEATLPGFRKGRAPRRLIERRFGSSVRDETRNQLIAQAYSKVIEEHDIETVGDPDADDLADLEVTPGQPFTFTVEVEVAPQFDLPDLSSIEIKKPLVEVTDEHIDTELERQQQQFGTQEEVEGKFKPGDRLQVDVVVTDIEEDKELEQIPEAIVALPREGEKAGHILGLHVDDLAKVFKGKGRGDTATYEAHVPETDERPMIRGKHIRLDLTIRNAFRINPAAAEEVAEGYGLADVAALRDEIRGALAQRADSEQRSAMREQVCEKLLEVVDFTLPEKLSASQMTRSIDRQRVEMLYRGMSVDEVEERIAEIRAESEEEARRRLKLFFILSRLAKAHDITAEEAEVNGRIAQIAAQRRERPEKLRAELIQDGRINQLALQIREHKAMDRVIDDAKISEISAEEWNQQVDERKAATSS